MNSSNLKRFAQLARRKLITQVSARLELVLTTDSSELREKAGQLRMLREEINRSSKALVIDKVAYTWFNRLMALRFMDVNDYQPLNIRVVTPADGHTLPEILQEAKQGHIPDELPVKKQHIFDLLDGRIPAANAQNEAYKELLIGVCNHLHKVFPFMFERINDYTELLLPDDLTSAYSIVNDIREGMLPDDCKEVEIIGWLYQFYISERKDELINAKKKYKADEIAPVTQLFTPKWIVQYMVDNTLGQLWSEARPSSKLINSLSFYIKPANPELIPKRIIRSPEDIGFMDPCVGSAHILCYAFDLFYKIYEEEGYNPGEIPGLIITKNLFGIDIDDRAAQIAAFAVMMKGRQYSRRVFRNGIEPNIISLQNDSSNSKFLHAKIFGSLIKISKQDMDAINDEENTLFSHTNMHMKLQAKMLAEQYDIVVTNPPYLNSSYMEDNLKKFIEKEYASTKSDLFASFIIRIRTMVKPDGLIGYISPYVWMFISSYENLRREVIENTTIASLIQLEYNAFEPACVPVATFTLRNQKIPDYKGSYIKLSDFKGHENQAPKTLQAIQNPNCGWFYTANQHSFEKIPGNPIGYWLSNKVYETFQGSQVGDIAPVRKGNSTSNNHRFLRLGHEINNLNHSIRLTNIKASLDSNKYWIPYNKGGGYRRWYGFQEYVINWKNDAEEIRAIKTSVVTNEKFYMKPGLTWSTITSSQFSLRLFEEGFIFDNGGCCLFVEYDSIKNYILGAMNGKVFQFLLSGINPTLNFQSGEVSKFPINFTDETDDISNIVQLCINISKTDWNASETSWDFLQNELIRCKSNCGQNCAELDLLDDEDQKEILAMRDVPTDSNLLEHCYNAYQSEWSRNFFQLHQNEEELNRQFIEIYGLQEELTPDVPLEEITILQQELDRTALAKLNNKLKREPGSFKVLNYDEITLPFDAKEVMAQFISYAVGCMFGRYSLDKEGLILANQGETLDDYLNKLADTTNQQPIANSQQPIATTFLPDDDNIIPVLDDEWFEDDIVNRFYAFLKVTFGKENFEKNLAFIENSLGKNIRKYFAKDLYPDHIKRYKKRPIYWQFSSPKGSFNVLIYMHRYTPDTINNILNKYLRQLLEKLNNQLEQLNHQKNTGSLSEQNRADKEIDKLKRIVLELQEYERDIIYPLATERIPIDLDDGVLVNYNKLGRALKEVTGLNDKATKQKVKEFDWIDNSQIR